MDDRNPLGGLRLDPEGVRVGSNGNFYLSDEYGPHLLEFTHDGVLARTIPVPPKFRLDHPASNEGEELANNDHGRVPNHGFEGLAITPDGKKLLALLEGPLIQDGGKKGKCCRLLEVDLDSGATRELVVLLEHQGHAFSELLALNEHAFLALERDGKAGVAASFKRIVRIDTTEATDVSAIAALPASGPPADVKTVAKATFLDLLDPRFGLAGAEFPKKIEGLAIGPELPDGTRLLVVTSDNDFKVEEPTSIWVFGLPRSVLTGFVPQQFGAVRPWTPVSGG
jgi:hypothetical protein